MSVTRDIAESWIRPRAVIRRHLARGRSEPWVFSLLVAFLVLAFIAQWPRLARLAVLNPDQPLAAQQLATALGLLAMIPAFYALAALSHLAARGLGGQGGWYGARLALFWALLAASPAVLLWGLVAGFLGPGGQVQAMSVALGLGFLWLWGAMLIEMER